MSAFFLGVAVVLLLNVLVGLWRLLLGPTAADRMVSANLFGTTGVAILLLLAEAEDRGPLRDVALVLVVLAVVSTATFITRPPPAPEDRS
ncbi:monovalent cation/H+ antiporter complex subunit F [Myxococcus sp. SDU36]|uniref:monovalent cation/H+ antiporter complex subunit F n=1 Tax=Myxococcus sp. SDU36 TaxID=2831967 RepID=UPI0025429DDC|nr:monovalent cation/H+ antiporter complex subunit F [Myxococcus sp. SDU36]WIG98639.1 pH regulation protein F [Myxococcus sp. SDU36]